MIRKKLILLFCFVTAIATAQPYVSNLGRFQVDQIKGCAPFTVTAQSLVACGGACFYDFLGDGFSIAAPDHREGVTVSYTYAITGKFKLKFCSSNNCAAVDEIEIEVVANILPDFDLYTCSGNSVQVKVNDTNYNQYVINYSDGSTVTVPSGSMAKNNHAFTDGGGSKNISVKGRNLNAADNCNTNTKAFSAVATLPLPSFSSLGAISAAELDLQYVLPTNVLGRLEIATNNNSTFQQLKSTYKDARDTIKSLSNDASYYCFRLGAVDACTNAVAYSGSSICSMVLAASAKDGFNQLDWTTNSTSMVNYSLVRDKVVYVTGIPATDRTRNDIDALCNVNYCYQLVANYPGGVTSSSLEKCVTSFTTQKPPALTDLSATFNDASTVELSWANALQATEYSIYKNTSGGTYSLNTVLTSSPFIDTQTSLTAPTCYRVPYKDACDNSSINDIEACPVFLTGTVSSDNQVSLSWTAYQGWQAGVSGYRLEKYSQTGARLRVYPVTLTTTFLDDENDLTNQLTYYKVFAIPTDPTLPTVNSNLLEIIRHPNLFYPTSFTPDKQGPTENEIFKVFGQYVASFEMEIFNRWGELMFTTNDFDSGWDGTFRGVDQPDGTYAFVATITDFAGRSSSRSGSIVLLRTK